MTSRLLFLAVAVPVNILIAFMSDPGMAHAAGLMLIADIAIGLCIYRALQGVRDE